MGNLKLLDVVIGLVLMMSITSLAASTIVEAYSAIIKKRANELRDGIDRMLWGSPPGPVASAAKRSVVETKVIKSLSTTPAVHLPGRNMDKELFPSYLSPTAFVDIVSEVLGDSSFQPPDQLKARHKQLSAQRLSRPGATHAGLEQHYVESMQRMTGMYKRWSTFWLFLVGLAIAVIGNVSVFHAAESLWTDGASRDAVVAAAASVDRTGANAAGPDSSDLASISSTVDQLEQKGLPVGWTADAKGAWGAGFTWGRVGIVVGWLVTAMLVTLGAPFWFDLLGRLIALRTSGKPDKAQSAPTGSGSTNEPAKKAAPRTATHHPAMSRWLQGAAGAVVAVAAALGVYAPNFGHHPDVAYPSHLTEAATYVALGDSYSAGEGLTPYLPGTDDASGKRCHRSILAYGPVLGATTDAASSHFRACSGAVIADVVKAEQLPDGQAADPTSTVVTITVGGNDALFSTIVQFCALHLHCLDNQAWHSTEHADATLADFAAHQIPAIGDPLLPDLYAVLRKRFTNPKARFLVLGYPQLFTPGSAFTMSLSCQTAYATFSTTEHAGLRDLEDQLNGLIAHDAVAAGFEYVHVADAFVGHETCGPKGPWLYFLHGGLRELDSYVKNGGVDPGDFHPTASGQAMMARLVSCYTTVHPSDPYTGPPAPSARSVAEVVGPVAVGRTGDAVYDCATSHPTAAPVVPSSP